MHSHTTLILNQKTYRDNTSILIVTIKYIYKIRIDLGSEVIYKALLDDGALDVVNAPTNLRFTL